MLGRVGAKYESNSYPPIKVLDYFGKEAMRLHPHEALELRHQLARAMADESLSRRTLVGVRCEWSGARTWVYNDPSHELRVGDLVEVPTALANHPSIGTVVRVGGNSTLPLKNVTCRLRREALERDTKAGW